MDKVQYSKEAMELLRKSLNREIDSFELACAMHDMDKKYPGLGWGNQARIIESSMIARKQKEIDAQDAMEMDKKTP